MRFDNDGPRLEGIISFTRDCGDYPHMYVKVPTFFNWIEEKMNYWNDKSYQDWRREDKSVQDKVWVRRDAT